MNGEGLAEVECIGGPLDGDTRTVALHVVPGMTAREITHAGWAGKYILELRDGARVFTWVPL